ncbi:YbgC/FadM family acyl-CoA thioesterase [Planktomarina temperata]|nr:YbgC/FadM family acyl-CoA thioesterase [Planktomarina temperata]
MSHRFELTVYYEDTDMGGIVYYANYLKFIERARSTWVAQLGVDQLALQASGMVFAVRSIQAEYLAPARLGDQLEVVEMELTRDGKPVANSIKMLGFEGGDEISAERAFETALRAIQGCGAQGFELPKDQFATWRRVELTFNPEKMRVR